MLHKFPYDDFAPVEIPDANVDGVYTLAESVTTASPKQLIKQALEAPIGCERLRDQLRPGMKITIAVDDSSRSTRTELMLPLVLEEIASAGMSGKEVTVFVALGTHRAMSDEELRAKYTDQVVENYRIINPDWRDKSAYAPVGGSELGFTIKVHKEVLKADYVIGVGQTIAHMIAGFGGGCKIINPGCSDAETIGQMHWMCTKVPQEKLFAVRENAVRDLIDRVALEAGLKFIVNEVPGSAAIAGVFAGHPVEAHKKACEFAKSVCRVAIRQKTDIVLADAYPADIDFWQALKGLNAAYGAVRDGGTVILVTPCPEGACSQHPEVTEYGYSVCLDKIKTMVASGTLDKIVGANLCLGRQLLERGDTILVTTGISEKDTRAMGFGWAGRPEEALKMAFEKQGTSASVNVLYKASKMICVVE